MKTKQPPAALPNVREEWVSLTDPQALLLANDRLNDDFAGEYIAYVDHRRGKRLHRRIVAHERRLSGIHDIMDRLPKALRKNVVIHYASEYLPDVIETHADLPGRE
jgi:hypothetical protein